MQLFSSRHSAEYHHESLSPDSLRLLRPRYPLPGRLRLDVVEVSRRSAPAYRAVSYTWGDDRPSETIYLNHRPFYVRPNLRACLKTLTKEIFCNPLVPKFLWVDAICINQEDPQERNSQVSQMSDTYQNAHEVCVWLGSSLTEGLLDWGSWEHSIHELARRPYWTRSWVIQEFLLNNGVQIYCGDNCIRLAEFSRIAQNAANTIPAMTMARRLWDYCDGVTDMLPMLTLVMGRMGTLHQHDESPQSLQEFLVTHRRSQCSDPRDRVFALLGLISDEERQMLDPYFPDYSLSEYDVQLIALKHIIEYGGHELESIPWDKIFIGLGVTSDRRQKELLDKATRRNHTGRIITNREHGRSGGRRGVDGRPRDGRNRQSFSSSSDYSQQASSVYLDALPCTDELVDPNSFGNTSLQVWNGRYWETIKK